MKYLGTCILLVGVLLLFVAIVGHWGGGRKYESSPPRVWEKFDPELKARANTYPKLLVETQNKVSKNSSQREVMDVLYKTVIERFTHKEAQHTFSSNWILYLAGKIDSAFSHIRDPGVMVKNGHSLFCDQSSYLLLKLALAHDIKSRHVGLDGHVVMEAWYDSDWHLYDPDLEVVPYDAFGRVLSVEELAQNQELLEKYYGPHGVTHIVGSRQDNTYMSYPEGAWFEWKSNVLAYIEKAMEVLKFVLPMVLVLTGIVVLKRISRKKG